MKILKDDHQALLTKCDPVDPATIDELQSILPAMFELMYQSGGVGLAANQVGILQRFFIMDASTKGWQQRVLINPEIIKRSEKKKELNEGCLSYPNRFVKKRRDKSVKVRYTDYTGRVVTRLFTGFEAIIVQHEMDHLNGIPFLGDEYGKEK